MDYKKIKLSIIIPVYNMEKYLVRCLNSVVAATTDIGATIEVLIINDGSTDDSANIIADYCEKYSYMKQFNKKNGGLSDVKNYGLERAAGEYVIFLDSDDYVDSEIYKSMLDKAERDSADIVVCDIELTYDDATKNTVWPCTVGSRAGIFHQLIDMTMMPASWNKLVKRELYDGLRFPVGKNNEDIAVTPIVLARANKISVINKPYYKYYQRTGSIQNSTFSEKRFVILDTAKICVDRLNEVDDQKKELIKGSVYLHQVLSLAMYPIRREKLLSRYKMVKKYMLRVEAVLPDLWDNFEIKEFVNWDTPAVQFSRKVSIFLMQKHWYMVLSVFWSFCNVFYDFNVKLVKIVGVLRNGKREKK